MAEDKKDKVVVSTANVPAAKRGSNALVNRSAVPTGLDYGEYRPYLRYDFFFSCAYCTMSEAEAQAIRFTIDHYEPRKAKPELVNEYGNLMYACDECNLRKGDRYPPDEARADGYRFFRPDTDAYPDHFKKSGIRIDGATNIGDYSIKALDLNRQFLRRIRHLRERLTKCDRLVLEGVLGLRAFHVHQLPPNVRATAAKAIRQCEAVADKLGKDIDRLLRDYARSPLIDPDPEAEARAEERMAELKQLEAMYPGKKWRARN